MTFIQLVLIVGIDVAIMLVASWIYYIVTFRRSDRARRLAGFSRLAVITLLATIALLVSIALGIAVTYAQTSMPLDELTAPSIIYWIPAVILTLGAISVVTLFVRQVKKPLP